MIYKEGSHVIISSYTIIINMMKTLVLLAIFASVNAEISWNGIDFNKLEEINQIPEDFFEDSFLNCDQLIQKYGYPVETHEVQTDDGYLLTMHRIPGGRLDDSKQKNVTKKIPVFLMHALSCSSADWILAGPEKSLGYILADQGYDVWMGNARGNTYSKKHVTLSPKDPEFWKFSWNEMGYYDLPSMIDYVLNTTGYEKLQYIGHSQGTTSFFVMASERPEMNDKIMSMQAFAPSAFVSNAKTPIYPFVLSHIDTFEEIFDLLGIYDVFPNSLYQKYFANIVCKEGSKYSSICMDMLFILCGDDPDQLNATMLPVYLSHTPAGSSTRQLLHYAQGFISEKFRKYDFGPEKNIELYGSLSPPDYDLSKITAPVALHYGENDWAVDPIDVDRLYSQLGNSIGKFRVPLDKFSHLDFLYAIDAPTLLYNNVLDIMKEFNK